MRDVRPESLDEPFADGKSSTCVSQMPMITPYCIVTNVPNFLRLFRLHNYYVSFDSPPDIKTSNLIYLEDTKGMIVYR